MSDLKVDMIQALLVNGPLDGQKRTVLPCVMIIEYHNGERLEYKRSAETSEIFIWAGGISAPAEETRMTEEQLKAEFIANGGVLWNCVVMVYGQDGTPFKIIEPPRIPVKDEYLLIDGESYRVIAVVFVESGPTRIQVGWPLLIKEPIFGWREAE